MSLDSPAGPISNKDKFKALAKQAVISAAMNVVPGPVAFMIEIGQEAYKLWGSSDPEEREAYQRGARALSEAEVDQLQAELAEETGVDDRAVVDLMVESVRQMRHTGEDEALRSINASLHQATNGHATITPQSGRSGSLRLNPSAINTMMGAGRRRVEHSGRSAWPQVEGFEINGVLGSGAAGTVYLAKQLSEGGRVCALKVGQLESATRFEREVSAMRAVDHPHLIDLWGSGQLNEPPPRYWIAMPNVGGLTLADVWRQNSVHATLSLSDKLKLMGEVLSGLVALHQAGLVHRDLKPANALVTPHLSVRLADFGLSKEAVKADETTETATSVGLEGTPAYMSPEQVQEDRQAGAEVDVWAFGVMLYEAIKGERPFKGNNLMILGGQILNQAIDVEGAWVPNELQSVLSKSLERDPRQRYGSALEIQRPYQEGAGIIIDRHSHNELRGAWTELETAQLLYSIHSVDELGDQGWRGQLTSQAAERVAEALVKVSEWRAQLAEAADELEMSQRRLSEEEVQHIQASISIAHEALASHQGLVDQWRAWHSGLCHLERKRLITQAQLEATQLRVRVLDSANPTFHQSLTAYGRADYDQRERTQRQALSQLGDLKSELNRRAEELTQRARQASVGQERQQAYDQGVIQGEPQGKRAARQWIDRLVGEAQANEESREQLALVAQARLAEMIQAWTHLTTYAVDHDRAGQAWRQALDSGELARFCLDQALSPPAQPQHSLTQLEPVSPQRLGEVLAKGMTAAVPLAIERAHQQSLSAVAGWASAGVASQISAHTEGADGVTRLQRSGHLVGFSEAFRDQVQDFVDQQSRRAPISLRPIEQALRSELTHDLRAQEELQAIRRQAQIKRRNRLAVIAVVLLLLGAGWLAVERAERERVEAIARAERERVEAIARGDQIGPKFINIPAGSFQMGSNDGDSDEKPMHSVNVKAFLMSESEVTVGSVPEVRGGRAVY